MGGWISPGESMHKYPEGLLDWSGDKAGGVKKLFYKESGRPVGDVVKTGLLDRLRAWARDIAEGNPDAPHAVFLVGGPGNGKTEAVEFTIDQLDAAMRLGGGLRDELSRRFTGLQGPSSRRVETQETKFPERSGITTLAIVQDASEAEQGDSATPAECLCDDIRALMEDAGSQVYMACVNRGVLDDALILAGERGQAAVASLIKCIVQSSSLSPEPIACWPLESFPKFASWPMDVESLVEESKGGASAALQILEVATNEHAWQPFGTCEAGERCPFCTNRRLLAEDSRRSSFIRILRWYELASGKRWNFRDLFSLTAFLLAGSTESSDDGAYKPCRWAASMLFPKERDPRKLEVKRVRGLFKLVAAQYQHSLFREWPVERAAALRNDLRELKLESEPALAGLQQFLALDKRREPTSTLRTQLASMGGYLDPAYANPALDVAVSANTTIKFEDLDRCFSLSIGKGRSYLQKYQCLTKLEIDLLKALEVADALLSDEATRRRKPATAERVQAFIRLVACRIARRSVGVRAGTTKDADALLEFDQVLKGSEGALNLAIEQVENLLNKDRRFFVCLNTTFGEPLPPPERRVMLATDIQRVRPKPLEQDEKRPKSPVLFLSVGNAKPAQPVALTYELFRATKSLRKGLASSSLPRSVVALLDITRARLAGAVVRDEDALQNSEIHLGIREDVVTRSFGTFRIKRRKS